MNDIRGKRKEKDQLSTSQANRQRKGGARKTSGSKHKLTVFEGSPRSFLGLAALAAPLPLFPFPPRPVVFPVPFSALAPSSAPAPVVVASVPPTTRFLTPSTSPLTTEVTPLAAAVTVDSSPSCSSAERRARAALRRAPRPPRAAW